MKSLVPLAAVAVLGVGAIFYIYLKQRDKDNKKKRPSEDEASVAIETLEFNVKNSQVPLIVGRNSVNLKSIEEKTKTIIRFRECDGENQICMIKGKVNDVKLAKQLIDEEKKKPSVITDELLVPTSSCGKIEGYSGSVLHEICQKSSAKVWVDPATRKSQGESRRVLITGTKEQVELAKKLIEEKIKEPAAPEHEEKKDEPKRSPRVSPFGSSSSITATETPREIMLPSPERLRNNDGRLEVFVSACATPSRFWVQLCGPQNTELDFLVDAMTEYYNQKENQELHKIREPYLGQIVAAMFLADNKWYRAEVVAIEPNDSNELVLDVYFLDYGDQQFVGRNDILELNANFLSLRFQAIECFLAHVQPTNTGSRFEEWDRKAIEAFESMVQVAQWKKMISKVVTYKERKSFTTQRSNQRESSPVPGVELYEENSDKNIALELVRMGHAEISDRFGDLAKSSVLVVKEDEKEATPEPAKEDKKEIEPEKGETIFSEPVQENKQEEEEEIVPQPLKEQTPPLPAQSTLDTTIRREEVEKSEQPSEDIQQRTAEDSSPSHPSSNEIEGDSSNETPANNNNGSITVDPKVLSNGKPKSTEDLDGSSNNFSKPPKTKKKKPVSTADFLKNEQASSANSDWNAMMDE